MKTQASRIRQLKKIQSEFSEKQSELENRMYEYTTSYLAGEYKDLDDQSLVNMVKQIALWLCEQKHEVLQVKVVAYLLLLDQWGLNLKRIQPMVGLSLADMEAMMHRLVENGLIRKGHLIHPWYDAAGSDLKCQILIYKCVMQGQFNIPR